MSKTALTDAIRACKGSKAELAKRLGVSRQVVWNWKWRGFVPDGKFYDAVLVIAREARK